MNNGTNFLVHAAAQPKIALQNTQISMESRENNTGMKMFAAADVSHLTVLQTHNTETESLLRVSNGDLILKNAFACKSIEVACQDSTGMRLTHNATAFQRPAQLTTTGTEPDVLANAIQRIALSVLTGRKNGANAETYH